MVASYHIDPFKYSLQKLKADLLGRKLIPSREPLKEGLDECIQILEKFEIDNLGDLINSLKNKKKLTELSSLTGVDENYLNLLRREANSYLPNPVGLDKFKGFLAEDLQTLAAGGIKNSRHIFERLFNDQSVEDLARSSGIGKETLYELLGLADLVRAYGVGPAFARLLYDAGIHSISDLRGYSPQQVVDLYEGQTGKKADFSTADIKFSLDLIRDLDIGGVG